MVTIDYILLFVTLAYSIMGMMRGFSSQLISFISWSLFIFILFFHLKFFTDIFSEYISIDYAYIRIITIISMVISTFLLILILNVTLGKLLAATVFQQSNRLFGLIVALMKSQIYIFIFILLVINTPLQEDIFKSSFFLPYYLEMIDYISNYDDSLFNSLQI
jgi:membrane protein required for colicin V production